MPDADTDAEQRLARLEDEQAIRDTLYRYGHSLDYGLEDDWLDCFTEDALWESSRDPIAARGASNRSARGHAEILQFIRSHTRPPEAWHKHMLCATRIEIAGDRCTTDSYHARVDAHRNGPYIRAFGRYRDTLVRCPDGRWRIQHRVAEINGTHPNGEPDVGPAVWESFAIEDIKRLKARYCRLLDTQQWEQWGELFTDDAHMWYGPAEADAIDGRDAIVMRAREGLTGFVTVHNVTMPDIEIVVGPSAGDRQRTRKIGAHGMWGMTDVTEPTGTGSSAPPRRRWGYYEDTYDLGDDEHWRIRSLKLRCVRTESD